MDDSRPTDVTDRQSTVLPNGEAMFRGLPLNEDTSIEKKPKAQLSIRQDSREGNRGEGRVNGTERRLQGGGGGEEWGGGRCAAPEQRLRDERPEVEARA
jgi:hypothetical protein